MIEGLVRTHVKEMQAEFTDSIMAAIDDLNTRLKRVEEVMSKPSNNNINGEGMDEANKSSSTRGQGSSSSSTTSSSSSSSVDMLREAVARVEHLVEESDKNTNNQ